MRTRHKQPTLVSMWMLDVFCCALGCVILLWVLESLSSTEQSKKARNALQDLSRTKNELVATQDDFTKTKSVMNATVQDLRGELAVMTAERDEKDKDLIRANADLADTKKSLAIATSDLADAKNRLAAANEDLKSAKEDVAKIEARVATVLAEMKKKDKAAAEVTTQLVTASSAEATLQKLLRERLKDIDALTSQKKQSDDRLSDLDAKYRSLQADAKDTSTAMAMAKKAEIELAAARSMLKDMVKGSDDSNATIVELRSENRKLADKFDRLRIDSENKFAGVAMSGKNVVFLIDISGSMKLLDEKTPAPEKWPGVIETVGKVMKSNPALEKFQVVIFSREAKYLFGTREWFDYKGDESVKKVTAALKDTTPGGDTNLYEGFDFSFRMAGLDTIYLFSDGLPTSGQGLAPQQEKTLNDNQRTEQLSKHLLGTLKTTWNPLRGNKKIRINAIGFFYESPEVGAFLWALARENDGSFVGMSKP